METYIKCSVTWEDKGCHLVVDPLACKYRVFASELIGTSPATE